MTMAVAELTLFGGFGVRAPSEGAINLLGQKERALLAFLALPPGTTIRATSWRACCGATGAIRRPGTA